MGCEHLVPTKSINSALSRQASIDLDEKLTKYKEMWEDIIELATIRWEGFSQNCIVRNGTNKEAKAIRSLQYN